MLTAEKGWKRLNPWYEDGSNHGKGANGGDQYRKREPRSLFQGG